MSLLDDISGTTQVSEREYQALIDEAWKRGAYDARKERAPIFRRVRGECIATSDNDHGTENWTPEMRAAYIAGYCHADY
jgi:hypothetical protein